MTFVRPPGAEKDLDPVLVLSKYEEAVNWLENAARVAVEMNNIDCVLENSENCLTVIQDILQKETNPLRQSALFQVVSVLMENKNLATQPAPPQAIPKSPFECNFPPDTQAKRCYKSLMEKFQPDDTSINFTDVAGLTHAKQALKEAIYLPIQFPHLFTGAVKPWKRMLLYGPPGTGKTRLAQALCGETKCRFYCVSSCDIISSWVGESERIVRGLFEHARQSGEYSVLFIDEIDSICRARNNREDEHVRRVKTEFLQQMEGASWSLSSDKLFVLCATNCPWELDPAFIRRFQKRIYIPLPTRESRRCLLKMHMKETVTLLSENDWKCLEDLTEGYSGSDISNFVADAVLQPIREIEKALYWKRSGKNGEYYSPCEEFDPEGIKATASEFNPSQVNTRCVSFKDFNAVYKNTHPTVTEELLQKYEEYTKEMGERS